LHAGQPERPKMMVFPSADTARIILFIIKNNSSEQQSLSNEVKDTALFYEVNRLAVIETLSFYLNHRRQHNF
jgi:hypothetical protein